MDKFEEKMKEALHEVTNGFEVSGEIKERIKEKIRKAETDISESPTEDKPPHYGHHPPYAAVCISTVSDERRKTLELFWNFFKMLFLSFPKSGRFVPTARKTENFCRYKKIDTYL